MTNILYGDVSTLGNALESLWGQREVQAPPNVRANPETGLKVGSLVLFVDSFGKQGTGECFVRKGEWWIRSGVTEFKLNSVKVLRSDDQVGRAGDIRDAVAQTGVGPFQPRSDTRPQGERELAPHPTTPGDVKQVVIKLQTPVIPVSTKDVLLEPPTPTALGHALMAQLQDLPKLTAQEVVASVESPDTDTPICATPTTLKVAGITL